MIICWTFAGCSSSRGVQRYVTTPEPILLTEEQQLEYDHDFIEGAKLKMFGNLPDAASLLTGCTEVNPYDAAAHFQLAEIYSMANDYPHALRHARLADRYDSDNEWYKMQLANLYLEGDYIDSAIVVYRQLIELQPDNADLRYSLTFLYLETNQYRKALKELDRIQKTYGFT